MSNHTLHGVTLFTWETNAINHPQRTDFLWLLAASTSKSPTVRNHVFFFLVKSVCLVTLWYCNIAMENGPFIEDLHFTYQNGYFL